MLTQTLGLRWFRVPDFPPAFILSETVIPHIMFFLNPSFCFASFALQYFLLVSVFSLFSTPQLPPEVRISSLRRGRGAQEVQFNFSSDHEYFKSPRGKQQLEYQSAATKSPQRNYHYSLSVNAPRGLRKGVVSANIHILSQQQSDPISAVNVILHRQTPMGIMSMEMNIRGEDITPRHRGSQR